MCKMRRTAYVGGQRQCYANGCHDDVTTIHSLSRCRTGWGWVSITHNHIRHQAVARTVRQYSNAASRLQQSQRESNSGFLLLRMGIVMGMEGLFKNDGSLKTSLFVSCWSASTSPTPAGTPYCRTNYIDRSAAWCGHATRESATRKTTILGGAFSVISRHFIPLVISSSTCGDVGQDAQRPIAER